MNPEIIASMAGALFTAIATIIVALIQKPSKKSHKPYPKKQNLLLFVVASAFVGGLVGYLLGIWLNSPISTSAPTLTLAPTPTPIPCSFHSKPAARRAFPPGNLTGSIISPGHCEMGIISGRQSPITVEGVAEQVPNNNDLWLFVYAPDGKYYPQCNTSPATKAECTIRGEWSMRTYLGSECKPYHLVLVSTDNEVTNFLLSTLNTWESSGSYTGLRRDELKPYKITELYSIQVETGVCAAQTPTP